MLWNKFSAKFGNNAPSGSGEDTSSNLKSRHDASSAYENNALGATSASGVSENNAFGAASAFSVSENNAFCQGY